MRLRARISIHAAREGGDGIAIGSEKYIRNISIHAAREGGDNCEIDVKFALRISIHAAREGGDARRVAAFTGGVD